MQKIKLTKEGYEEFLKQIAMKEEELANLRLYKGLVDIYQGDNWHDNPALYQSESKERSLMQEIATMKHDAEFNIEIVENLGDADLIDIGDVIKVEMIFSENNRSEKILRLVGTSPNFSAEISEVSINSPIGKAMYHQQIGKEVSYKVETRIIKLYLKEKIKELEQENPYTLKRTK